MAREFRLPDIGEGLTEAEIVRWLVAEGESVTADQPVVEVETDKAVVEIPSPYAGVVLRHGGPEGATIQVGEVLVVIGEPEEATAAPSAQAVTPTPTVPAFEAPRDPEPIVGTLDETAESLDAPVSATQTGIKALPVVRKLARDHGIDLTSVRGTGPGGRITRQDVEGLVSKPAAATAPVTPAPPRPEEPAPPPAPPTIQAPSPAPVIPEPATPEQVPESPAEPAVAAPSGDERRPMSRLRRTIAANMTRSWSEVPHVTTFDDIDATRFLEVRDALTERHGVKVPIEALVIKAVIPALSEFPEFNATLDGDELIVHGRHDIGIAVDTPDGLLVAVIPDAGSKGVLDLASEVRRLGEGSRSRRLTPAELTGQTFTISNIGAVGGGHGTPIVPPGTTAILSVGRAKSRPIVYQGDVVIAPVMPLSLSYDHRVIDGAQGRRFMALVMENLEEPALFLAG